MKIYVDIEEVIEAIKPMAGVGNKVLDRIRELPADPDVVKVTRCANCKFNCYSHKCLNPDTFFLIPDDFDYCSCGRNKDETD